MLTVNSIDIDEYIYRMLSMIADDESESQESFEMKDVGKRHSSADSNSSLRTSLSLHRSSSSPDSIDKHSEETSNKKDFFTNETKRVPPPKSLNIPQNILSTAINIVHSTASKKSHNSPAKSPKRGRISPTAEDVVFELNENAERLLSPSHGITKSGKHFTFGGSPVMLSNNKNSNMQPNIRSCKSAVTESKYEPSIADAGHRDRSFIRNRKISPIEQNNFYFKTEKSENINRELNSICHEDKLYISKVYTQKRSPTRCLQYLHKTSSIDEAYDNYTPSNHSQMDTYKNGAGSPTEPYLSTDHLCTRRLPSLSPISSYGSASSADILETSTIEGPEGSNKANITVMDDHSNTFQLCGDLDNSQNHEVIFDQSESSENCKSKHIVSPGRNDRSSVLSRNLSVSDLSVTMCEYLASPDKIGDTAASNDEMYELDQINPEQNQRKTIVIPNLGRIYVETVSDV